MSIRLDEHADSEGNFSVLAFKPTKYRDGVVNCNYSMIPVGHFQQSNREFPVSSYSIKERLAEHNCFGHFEVSAIFDELFYSPYYIYFN